MIAQMTFAAAPSLNMTEVGADALSEAIMPSSWSTAPHREWHGKLEDMALLSTPFVRNSLDRFQT